MEYEYSPLSWEFHNHHEGLLEDLKHSLMYTTLELEATIISAKEEITKKENELISVNDVLNRVIKERDEARAKYEKFVLEKQEFNFNQQSQSQNENENSAPNVSSSDCEENSITKTTISTTLFEAVLELAEKKTLPEKGKFLKAVVEAGPLLQTLLLAGPLPQWQHPPPQLNSIENLNGNLTALKKPQFEIPSVLSNLSTNVSCLRKKRNLVLDSCSVSDSSVSKCRKVFTCQKYLPLHQIISYHIHHFLCRRRSVSNTYFDSLLFSEIYQ